MTNEAKNTVGSSHHDENREDNSAVGNTNHGTGDEKVITIRLERLMRDDKEVEQFDRSTAVQNVLRSIVNHNDKVNLLSIDEKDEINNFDKFRNEEAWEKFVNGIWVSMNTGSREAYVFKLKTATTVTFRQLKYLESTMDALTKWKLSMNHHGLNFHNSHAKLIFNLFLIHPFWVNKGILASQIDKIIKTYVNEEASESLKRKWGCSFCKLLRDTKDTVVEIGLRNWKTDYVVESGDTVKVSTKVLTMRVDGQILREMKDVVNCIQWDKYMVVKMIEENPKLNGTASRVNLVAEHNELWSKSAYVHLSWMPERMWSMQLPDHEDKTVEEVLLEAVREVDGTEKKLFRSINKIKDSTGLYYLITTKQLLHDAETFATQLMANVCLTNEFKEDRSLQNPEGYDILVGQKTDWDRSLRKQNGSMKSIDDKNINRERHRHTTKQSQNSTRSKKRDTSIDRTTKSIEIITEGAIKEGEPENSNLPSDILQRLERLEEQVEEMQAQQNQILLLMNEQAALLESNGLAVSSTQGNGILKDSKRVTWSSNPPSTHTVDIDEETVLARNPRSKYRYHFKKVSRSKRRNA